MNKIQLLLRNNIRKIIKEAFQKEHFKDRVYDRLLGNFTNFTNEKEEIKKRFFDDIQFVTDINFLDQTNIGINLGKGSIYYKYDKTSIDKSEFSEGGFVWLILRANELETIVFGNHSYKPKNTQFIININTLKEYIQNNKKGKKEISEKDLKIMSDSKIKKVDSETVETMPVLNVKGVKYVYDKDKEIVYQKNKPENKENIFDFIEKLDKEEQKKLYSILEENKNKTIFSFILFS